VRSAVRFGVVLIVLLATTIHAAEQQGRKAFVDAWQGRTVVLKRPLYSVIFNERRRFMPLTKRASRVAGITVVTPTETYYQFDSLRDEEPDIVERDPNRIIPALQNQYRRSAHLDVGNVQDIEAVMLTRYEPGVTLVVQRIQFDNDRVRVLLRRDDEDEVATALTVHWPTPLSKPLTEAPVLGELLARFIAPR
jgi:hypothetical protein